jgi:hypothetical protein
MGVQVDEIRSAALLRRFPRLALADPEPRLREHFVLRSSSAACALFGPPHRLRS